MRLAGRIVVYALAALTLLAGGTARAAPLALDQAGQPGRQATAAATVADVADRARPAVAFIAVRTTPAKGASGAEPQGGVGSGAIFDPRGYIVTNNHVVEGAQQMRVVLPDGRTYDARLVGRDPPSDLAVIKIEPGPASSCRSLRVRRLRQAEGRRVGRRDRQRARPRGRADRHGRRRLGARPRRPGAERRPCSRTSSRPTPRSTPATPAARC